MWLMMMMMMLLLQELVSTIGTIHLDAAADAVVCHQEACCSSLFRYLLRVAYYVDTGSVAVTKRARTAATICRLLLLLLPLEQETHPYYCALHYYDSLDCEVILIQSRMQTWVVR